MTGQTSVPTSNLSLWVKELLGINPNRTLKKSHLITLSLCIWDPAQGQICSPLVQLGIRWIILCIYVAHMSPLTGGMSP